LSEKCKHQRFIELYQEAKPYGLEGPVGGDIDGNNAFHFRTYSSSKDHPDRKILFDVEVGEDQTQLTILPESRISSEQKITTSRVDTKKNQTITAHIREVAAEHLAPHENTDDLVFTETCTLVMPLEVPVEGREEPKSHTLAEVCRAFFALLDYDPGSAPWRLRMRPEEGDETHWKDLRTINDGFDFWN